MAAERAFGDIEELAVVCRFGDCGHAGEPGCAVAAAVAAGALTRERFEAWQRAERDRIVFERRGDPEAQSAERAATARRTAHCARRVSAGWV